MPFKNYSITKGGALTIPQIMSTNFNIANPSASPTPSWAALKTGILYAFGLVLSGGTITGPDYIINTSGIFIYSGTPANGNLIGSWAGAAGTDAFGNAYPQGFNVTKGAISGTVFSGTNFVLNTNGLFLYNGTPGLGTLVVALTPAVTNDAFGNNFDPGLTVGKWNGLGVLLNGVTISTRTTGLHGFYVSSSSGAAVANIDPATGALLVYNSGGVGLGNLIASIAPAAGTDSAGNTFPQGLNVTVGTISGTTFTGTNFVINTNGTFFYLGAPAAGNLSCSVVPGSAQVLDPQGNKALPGFTYYLTQSGKQLAVNTSQPFGSGGTAVYLASTQAGPWTISSALLSYAVDLAGTDVNMAIEAATLTFSATSMQTLTPLEIGDGAILDNISTPALTGGAATLYASSGHQKYVASADGNAYNTGRLTSIVNSPVTCNNTAAFTTITSAPVAALTYKFRAWMLIHGGVSAGTGRLNLSGPSVSQCAVEWRSATGTTTPVYNELYATALGSFASQTLSTTDPSQLVVAEGTVTFSASGTLTLRGQPITSNTDTMIIDVGSYLEIEPVT